MNRQASGARFRQSVRMPTRSAIEQSDDPVYLIVDELIRLVNGRPTEEQVGFVRALSPGMRMMWGVFMVDGEVLRYIEGQVASPPEGWSLIDDDGAISIMCETWRVSPSELVGAAVDRARRGQRDFERRVERGEDPWLRMWNDGQELRIPRPDAGSPLLAHAEDLGVACHLAGRTDHGRGLASGDEAAVRRGVADAWHSVPECTTVRSR